LQSDFCDFTTLSIDDPVSGDRYYDIVPSGEEPELFDIYVSTKFLVEADGPGKGCEEQLTMYLETEVNDGNGDYWLEIQNEFTPFYEEHDECWYDHNEMRCEYHVESLTERPMWFE
jgi:hypothetical protein